MKRIYHPYQKWEDYPAGFYDNCSGEEKEQKIQSVLTMFNSEKLTREFMFKVVNEWKFSCEQNLTNESMNHIAYIGQAACCMYDRIPNTVTMEAWSLLTKDVQKRSDMIALEAIGYWKKLNNTIQLCLNFD